MISLRSDGKLIEFKTTKFSDGTTQCWQMKDAGKMCINLITFVWENDVSEIFNLLQIIDLVRSENSDAHIHLSIPFMPFSRQDKAPCNKSTFALHTFAALLNSKSLNLVTSFDVHSDAASKLINQFVNVKPDEFQYQAYNKFKADVIFYPDAGAAKRYSRGNHLYGAKIRNQTSGEITGYNIMNVNKLNIEGKRVLIVDDLADGGATFIEAAKELTKLGVSDLGLCVSHGLFSKGYEALRSAGISEFYTTNSIMKNKEEYNVYE